MSDDIVTRLRAVLHNDRSVELMNREAADEIERLRGERDATIRELRKVEAERDEARREVCRRAMHSPEWQREFAFDRGWDCFKEDER